MRAAALRATRAASATRSTGRGCARRAACYDRRDALERDDLVTIEADGHPRAARSSPTRTAICVDAWSDQMPRPIILGVVGDSAAGKTTITRGLVRLLGERARHPHRRRRLPPLRPQAARRARRSRRCTPTATTSTSWSRTSPTCGAGAPILKPVYRHKDGTFGPPVYVDAAPVHGRRGAARLPHADAARQLRRARLPRAARGAAAPVEGAARLLAAGLHDRSGARRARPPRARLGGLHPPPAALGGHRRLLHARRARRPGAPRRPAHPARRPRPPRSQRRSSTATPGACA